MKKILHTIGLCAFIVLFGNANAAQLASNITPQQLQQFKRLSPAQQKSLAQSMGVDLRTIQKQINSSEKNQNTSEDTQLQQYMPRGTQFDELGNPIFDPEEELLDEEQEDDSEPKPFGYDVFANAPLTFAPTLDIAVPENYIVGAGDSLSIQVFGKDNFDYQLPVTREGKVIIPELGAFAVSGMTFNEVKQFLANEIKNKVLGVEVVVALSDLRSIRVFVLGDAYKPGQYVLSSLSSITHALFAAGGISDIGTLRNIQLKRGGKLVTTLDLYDLLINGDSSNDVLLKSGDVVFINPIGDKITVDGEVTRPAIYELQKGETFQTAIKMAGGLLPSAYPTSTVVERFNARNLRTVKNIDLTQSDVLTQEVRAGDYIKVMKTSDIVEDSVTIIGAVARPGKYQWHQGLRINDLIPDVNIHLLADADLAYGLVVRERDKARNIEILQFSLFNIIADNRSQDNLELQPHDKVLIFSMDEIKAERLSRLDDFAFTSEQLKKEEKQQAKDNFQEKMFWLEYDAEDKYQKKDELDETVELASKTLEELTGGKVKEEVGIRELNPFSRKRLLSPIIEKLKLQAASGKPIQLVEIVGSVKFPGIYPLAKNAKVNDLLKASGGLLESAFLQKAEITRNEVANNMASKNAIALNLSQVLAGNEEDNILLQSKDRLNVLQIPSWQENHLVELRGEFMFPGKYTIRRGETLGQLIERVGGFTEYAYIEGSVFTREKLKQLELQNLLKVSESLRMEIASKSLAQDKNSQMVDYSQAKLLLADLTKVKPVGRLVVDLPRLETDKSVDVLLENGDVLYVPTIQNSINVIGQVQVATSHFYQDSLSAFDYIELSGGVKQQADDDRVYIIKANGAVEVPSSSSWFSSNDKSQLKPGDTVVVPLDSDYMNNLTLWATGTQIIYQAAVAIAAISGI
ncbi:sugar transporter [Thalassotalea insulae]|uniref:Sugar transporter n=1 Tax=Thalassotalea insulae TaxID=2056778 RepID=A0ABQ6GSD8_9GAMM|nr:SLBB domain-containing protein [Thalassotalea insulae]GLX77596.1 sugar transporter [Thalassotalea insulae]